MSVQEQIKPIEKGNELDYKKLSQDRELRAKSILAKSKPELINENTYLVPSQFDSNKKYKVTHIDTYSCECQDFQTRCKSNGIYCKHIKAIQFFLKFKNKVEIDDLNVDKEFNKESCVYCSSDKIFKRGVRKTKIGIKQVYCCKDCKRRFVLEPIKYIKGNAKLISLVMNDYFKGHSLRDIQDSIFQFYNLKVTHETIRRWIRKFCGLMNDYTSKFNNDLKLGNNWHVDEQVVKVNKNTNEKLVWNVLDGKTRFLIANNVTKTKNEKDARAIFQKAKEVTNQRPETISSDGLPTYIKAIKKEYPTHKDNIGRPRKNSVLHIANVGISKKDNNNMIERYHNEFREFEKIRRNFKKVDTLEEWNDNYRLYHNFIKKHMALNNLTPSQVANIDLNLGKNRWLSLLTQSIKATNVTNSENIKKSHED
ncbi:IS1/IS6 family transposase [Candidatus Woesearchaeota archaeon]|nr:IS1/IS6 family transposase [Candidatus Woesearchaeota archaeon]